MNDNEIDLKELFHVVWKNKKIVTTITIIFASLSVLISLLIPNIYTSTAILAPSNSQESLSSKLSGLSSLAGATGIKLPTNEITPSEEGVKRMESFEFFSKHFLPYIKLEDLAAVKEWSHEDNSITYNNKIFIEETKEWVRKVKYPKKIVPSDQEAYKIYLSDFQVSVDKKTSFIYLSISHQSPYIAEEWLNIIIKNINESMREIDKNNAQNSINFLNEISLSINNQNLRDAISNLHENQLQTLMLASSNEEYIFKTLDSPVAQELKSSPNRPLICIVGTFIGFFLSLLTCIFRYYFLKTRT